MSAQNAATMTTASPDRRSSEDPGEAGLEALEAVPVRHVARWVGSVLLLVFVANAVYSAANNPRFQWGLAGSYLFSEPVLNGLMLSLKLTAITMAIGIGLGVVLAVMRMSPSPLISGVSFTYVWVLRGTPLLVQLLFWSFISALYPHISVGVPFGGPEFFGGSANSVITPMVAAVLGLGLNEAAYMAEIVRSGILSVEHGQHEAAHALGMTRLQTLRRVVLPQAMRVIVPPTGNETITVLKNSSLVSVIAVTDLLYAVQLIYSQNFRQIPLLVVACFWYLIFTTILSVVQYMAERHYGRAGGRGPRSHVRRVGRLMVPLYRARREG
jgi:polar amino acid transport system permease protein